MNISTVWDGLLITVVMSLALLHLCCFCVFFFFLFLLLFYLAMSEHLCILKIQFINSPLAKNITSFLVCACSMFSYITHFKCIVFVAHS